MTDSRRLTKNEKRRLKKKNNIQAKETKKNIEIKDTTNNNIEIEYVSADVNNEINGVNEELADQFRSIFNKFAKAEDLLNKDNNNTTDSKDATAAATTSSVVASSSEKTTNNNNEVTEPIKLSKRKKKLLTRLSIAQLKQLVPRPDMVEAHDVTAADPLFLIYLKSYYNSVPVPRHWCHIRKYLTGKVGMEKPPFELPDFIAETGIAKIRDTIMEQEALKKAKQKSRERIRPKMGKIDIDYQVLHDAFFKYQTKPKMTVHGDLYYEGKEFEMSWKEKKPGQMSRELKEALGMPGSNYSAPFPPPWLINMQRYGPPPSYRSMKIPGLNAPLPSGAQYGFSYGGWGKAPVDEYGRPLYGDVFGSAEADDGADEFCANVDRAFRWGAIEELEVTDKESDEGESEENEEIEEATEVEGDGMETPITVDGLGSIASGLETPDTVDLRKRTGTDSGLGGAGKELYKVIEERKASSNGVKQVFGSERTYVLSGGSDVQISINPDELEETLINKDKLKDAYNQQDQGPLVAGDGTATETTVTAAGKASTTKKRKIDSAGGAMKKMKEFKF